MANPENLSQPRKQVSVERGGLGQSGYTAGRREGDVSLDDAIDTRYVAPRGGPVSDVEHDGPGDAVAQPSSSANGDPAPASSDPDGA
jgi:hypothetical protein